MQLLLTASDERLDSLSAHIAQGGTDADAMRSTAAAQTLGARAL